MSPRVLAGAVGLSVALIVAGIAYLAFSIDAIVARAIEREGTRLVGAPVRVGSVDIDLSRGTGTVRRVRVSSPEGFEADEALRLEEIELGLDARSLRSQPFRLSRVRIEESTVHLEFDERGASNIERIARHVAEQPADDPAAEAEPTRFVIEQLRFAGGTIVLTRPDAKEPDRVELPEFASTGIGGSRGATGGEIAKKFAQMLTRQVAAATAGREVQRVVEKELGGAAGEAAGKVVRGILD